MKNHLISLFIFLGLSPLLHAQNNIIDSLFDAGNYESCITYIDQNPKVDLSLQKAVCLIRLNKLMEAEAILLTQKDNLPEILANKSLLKGQIYLHKGFITEAISQFEEAESYFSRHHDSYKLSEVYSQMGMTNWSQGNFELAMSFLNKALSIRIAKWGQNHIYTAAIYNNIGLVEDSRGNHDEAIKNYTLYLDAFKNKLGDLNPAVAIGYNNLGLVAKEEKDYPNALSMVQKSLAIRKAIYGEQHPNTAFSMVTIGEVYKDMEQYDSAKVWFNKALVSYKKLYTDKHPEIAAVYNLLAYCQESKDKLKDAIQSYQNALQSNSLNFELVKNGEENPKADDYRNPSIMLHSLLEKATVLNRLYNSKTLNIKHLKSALATLQTADTLVDKNRQLKSDKNDKLAVGKIAADIYENAIVVCFKLAEVTLQKDKYLQLAFYFSEKNKAAALMGAIVETDAKRYAGIPEALLVEEEQIKTNLNYYENIQAMSPSLIVNDSLFAYKNKYNQLIKNLEKQYPAYYQLKYAVNVVDVAALSKLVVENTMLISYTISDKYQKIFVFCIGADNHFSAKEFPLDDHFYRYLFAVKNGISFKDIAIFMPYSEKVYQQLFSFSISKKIQKLVIIPDGKLCLLPFELLIKPGSKANTFEDLPYLIKDYAISYQFSASLFAKENQVKMNVDKKMLICAPVHFPNKNNEAERVSLVNLNGTIEEANNLKAMADSNKVSTLCLLENNANESAIKSLTLKDFSYLHFASHGTVDEDHPELSKIYLYEKNTNDKEDGSLYASEIYNLPMNAELVTLSACETGSGKVTKGEGVVGLTRSLVFAGAKNIVVSHWKVSDRATAILMVSFYKKAMSSDNYATDLQKAKLELIASKTFAAPYYWAPFVLFGK